MTICRSSESRSTSLGTKALREITSMTGCREPHEREPRARAQHRAARTTCCGPGRRSLRARPPRPGPGRWRQDARRARRSGRGGRRRAPLPARRHAPRRPLIRRSRSSSSGRDVALGVGQRLPSHPAGGDAVEVGARHLEGIAEYPVVADPQVTDPGRGALTRLELTEHLLGAVGERARASSSSASQPGRTIPGPGTAGGSSARLDGEVVAQVGEVVRLRSPARPGGGSRSPPARHAAPEPCRAPRAGRRAPRDAPGAARAGTRPARGRPPRQAARGRVISRAGSSRRASTASCRAAAAEASRSGPDQPVPKQPRTHRSPRVVEDGRQRVAPLAGGVPQQLEVPDRGGIEDQLAAGAPAGEAGEVTRRRALRGAKVLDQGACDAGQGLAAVELEGAQRAHSESLRASATSPRAGSNHPAGLTVTTGLASSVRPYCRRGWRRRTAAPRRGEAGRAARGPRRDRRQEAPPNSPDAASRYATARCPARFATAAIQRRLAVPEQLGLGHRARGQHPDHLAANQAAGLRRILDLFRHRDPESGVQELADVVQPARGAGCRTSVRSPRRCAASS